MSRTRHPKASAFLRTPKESSLQSDVIQAAKVNGWSITLADVMPQTASRKVRHYLSLAYLRNSLAKIQDFLLRRRGHTFTLAYHTHDSRNSQKGFPDLVLIHPRRGLIFFVELKLDGEYPTIEQRLWRAGILAATYDGDGRTRYYLWTPSMWDEIIHALGEIDPRTLA